MNSGIFGIFGSIYQNLEEHGYIAIVKERSGSRGRPSERIYINPEYIKWKEEQK